MGVRAAKLGGGDHLARGRLHQRRAGEEDGALALGARAPHDHRLIRHGRHVGAAGGAGAHHAGDLGDALGRHLRLIVEDAAEVVAVGKNLRLMRQVRPAAIHQIDARQAVLQGDFLRPQVLLHRHGEVGAALHRRVVADDHHLAPRDAPDAADHPGAGRLAAIEAKGGELTDLQEWRAGVQQPLHPLPRQELAPRLMARP